MGQPAPVVDDAAPVPTLDGLRRLVSEWVGRPAYILDWIDLSGRPVGNHGDELMRRVFELILNDFGIRRVSSPTQASLLILPPSGALLDRYSSAWLVREKLSRLPDLPLVVFPSSAWFTTRNPALMFAGRRAPTQLILREPRSFAHLRDEWGPALAGAGVTLALDHDVVLSGHRHLGAALGTTAHAADGTLLAARMDQEAGDMPEPELRSFRCPTARQQLVHAAVNRVPARLRRTLLRHRARERQQRANEALLARVTGRVPDDLLARVRPDSFDVSSPLYGTYAHYARSIVTARAVITDRLHVAMPATLLGKPTVLVECGYHKLAGVYEHSLRGLPNVCFIARDFIARDGGPTAGRDAA